MAGSPSVSAHRKTLSGDTPPPSDSSGELCPQRSDSPLCARKIQIYRVYLSFSALTEINSAAHESVFADSPYFHYCAIARTSAGFYMHAHDIRVFYITSVISSRLIHISYSFSSPLIHISFASSSIEHKIYDPLNLIGVL